MISKKFDRKRYKIIEVETILLAKHRLVTAVHLSDELFEVTLGFGLEALSRKLSVLGGRDSFEEGTWPYLIRIHLELFHRLFDEP